MLILTIYTSVNPHKMTHIYHASRCLYIYYPLYPYLKSITSLNSIKWGVASQHINKHPNNTITHSHTLPYLPYLLPFPHSPIHTQSMVNQMPARKWNTMVDPTSRSKACPWLPRPINLDGTMVGDAGFDPLYLSSIEKNFAGFIQPPQWEDQGDGIR